MQKFDIEKDYDNFAFARQVLDATDPDLTAFRQRGGKLLMYFGWADPQLNPRMGLEYYEDVVAKMGPSTPEFARLFMVPGMFHCGGGIGTSTFDSTTPLIQWVEEGKAPASIPAARIEKGRRSAHARSALGRKSPGTKARAASMTRRTSSASVPSKLLCSEGVLHSTYRIESSRGLLRSSDMLPYNMPRRSFLLAASATSASSAPAYSLPPSGVDITPPLGSPIYTGTARSIVDPLEARGVILSGSGRPLVIVALDWCEVRNNSYDLW